MGPAARSKRAQASSSVTASTTTPLTTTAASGGVSSSKSRMDAARGLLRMPPSPSTSSPLRDHRSQHAVPQAEWTSPSFTRARARPSNLHSYLRSSPSFPLNPSQQQLRGNTSDAPSSNGGRTTITSAGSSHSAAMRSEPRSQRTQATQTLELTQEHAATTGVGDNRSVHLGSFGAVSTMTLDTIDFLIRVLEDRKQELLVPPEGTERARHSASAPTARTAARARKGGGGGDGALEDEYTESSDASDGVSPAPSPPAPAALAAAAAPTRAVRSRSYEALVQLEGILEARHQQLMNNGVLEPGMAPYDLN